MPSPFPGMDPYLGRFWNDVHGKLITYIADELNDSLPARYRAALQKRVVIADPDQPVSGELQPDVAVLEVPTQYSIEIIDTKFGEKVVTAIEVLSPENKRVSDGMRQFQKKQEDCRRAGVSRVEIDLLRAGRRMFEFPLRLLAADQLKPYYVTIHRGAKPGECELYAIDLREPLPVIGVPLRATDADVPLDLQSLIDHVYRTGRFPIDYGEACEPALDESDLAWVSELIVDTA